MFPRQTLYPVLLFLVFSAIPVQAQTADQSGERQDIFIAPLAEVIGYSRQGPSFGGGFALGAGDGIAVGMRFLYAIDTEDVHTMEMTVFTRFYLRRSEACTGPFVQINIGAAIFDLKHTASPPAEVGAPSAGIAAGWRFPLGKRWYIEPAIRLGYPYIAGAGAAFAFRL
ncbi:MAG: DUF3575 domain-containing protein [Treponema sp.]|nr:DUF3575 domain-containing protein [Treponema sp.]